MPCWMKIQCLWRREYKLPRGLNCTSKPGMILTLWLGNDEDFTYTNYTLKLQRTQFCLLNPIRIIYQPCISFSIPTFCKSKWVGQDLNIIIFVIYFSVTKEWRKLGTIIPLKVLLACKNE